MINAAMRSYNYFTFGSDNGYGMPQLSEEPKGKVKMAIFVTNQAVVDTIKYKDASYIGLTNDAKVNDTYVIEFGAEKLKVLYVQPEGRFKQVYLGTYD